MAQVIEIKAREGYYLTQVGNVGPNRMYFTSIKGVNIKPDEWREATEQEKLDYEADQPIEENVQPQNDEQNETD